MEGQVSNRYTHDQERRRDRQRAGIRSDARKLAESRKTEGQKEKKGRWRREFSIHPGPGDLVHRGRPHLEGQSLPVTQKTLSSFRFTFSFD